jgi:hypothetical protein
MANIFSDEWQICLGAESYSVDVIASVTETAIQHILDKHFQFDNDKYTLEINRTLPDGQMDRKFLVRISAGAPIQVQLPPFTAAKSAEQRKVAHLYEDQNGWDNLGIATPEPKLYVPRASRGKAVTPNVRVFCPKFTFHIEWPKLHDNNAHWSWDPTPLNLLAEARITLEIDSDGPYLKIEPTRIKFDQVSKFQIAEDFRRFIEKLPDNEKNIIAADDDKFNDLLVIALNIAAVQFGPKLVSNIRLPVPVLANKKIVPSLLQMENKMVTLGGSLDFSALAETAQKKIASAMNTFAHLLEADIKANGGFSLLVAEPEESKVTSSKRLKLLSRSQIESKLTRVNDFIAELEAEVKIVKTPTKRSTKQPAVPNGFGVGLNEYFLNSVIQAVMPQPTSNCTDEQSIFDFLKGWACYWAKLYNPLIAINGTTVSGQVNVDVGGALHACIRKFWDCSWSWSCAELDLAVRGNPGLDLELLPGKGITFAGQITGQLDLETNLPDPFDAVIKAFSGIIWDGIKVILNAFLSVIVIEVFPPTFSLPEQKTKLQFSDFSPFGFLRNAPATLPAPKLKYIGYSVGLTATN